MFVAALFTTAKSPPTDEQIVAYPYNGILFSHKTDCNIDHITTWVNL